MPEPRPLSAPAYALERARAARGALVIRPRQHLTAAALFGSAALVMACAMLTTSALADIVPGPGLRRFKERRKEVNMQPADAVPPPRHVANNAALQALTDTSLPVERDGFAAAGDGGQARYSYSPAGCPVSGGDGGTQVPAGVGGCWLADRLDRLTPKLFGGLPGTADSAVAFRAELAAALRLNLAMYVPCGTYTLLSAVNGTVPAGRTLVVRGDGHGCVDLHFPASNGFQITKNDQFANLLFETVTLTTDDSTGAYTAVAVAQPSAVTYTAATGQPSVRFFDVDMHGTDAGTTGAHYWGKGLDLTNLGNVEVGGNSKFTGARATSTVAISVAAPAVVTTPNHYPAREPVQCTTTGALPTGLVAGQIYYVLEPTASSFALSATPGGAAITTSGSQSGIHTCQALALGRALGIQGLTQPQSYAIQTHVQGLQVFYAFQGIYEGDFVQGTVIDGGTNCTLCAYGVDANPIPVGTPDQLVFASSQTNTWNVGLNIPAMNGLDIHDAVIIVSAGHGIAGLLNWWQVHDTFIQCVAGAPESVGILVDAGTDKGGVAHDNNIDGCPVPVSVPIATYAYAYFHDNHITDTPEGRPWYAINPAAIGVRVIDPTVMSVASLKTRLPCAANLTGSGATVNDSVNGPYGGALSGGGTAVANAICQGAMPGYVAH